MNHSDEFLIQAIRAGNKRWRTLLIRAIASRLRRAAAGDNEAFEDHVGPIEDCLLDATCAFRAMRASIGGRGDRREAATEAGESLLRLMEQLAAVSCEALATSQSPEK